MEKTKRPLLFQDFQGIPTGIWEEKIKADLKGADYEKKLIWRTDEGIDVLPYYREEDLESLRYLENVPCLRAETKEDQSWIICQDIEPGKDIEKANARINKALQGGAGAIRLRLSGAAMINKELFYNLLKEVSLSEADFIFHDFADVEALYGYLTEILSERGYKPSSIEGSLGADPLGKMAVTGIPAAGFDKLAGLMGKVNASMPGMRLIDVNGSLFQEAGATLTEELAFSLSMASEYMAALSSEGLDPDKICRSMQISMTTGPNYFMEIAKLRAFRLLWAKIAEAYGIKPAKACIRLRAATSGWNLTLYDRHVNMLRGTTEAMSALLGGADIVSVLPFDQPFGKGNEFSDRIARNVQIILRDEAYFGKVMDPSAGSYFIENLTDKIAEKAWELFREVEAKKGFRHALEAGWIQEQVDQSREKKLERVASGRDHLLGTNAFPDFNELIKNQLPNESDKWVTGSSLKPLRPFRLASAFEELRLETEAFGKRPGVFLFKYGNPAWVSARSTFSANFFACAGYKIIDRPPAGSIDAGIEAAKASGAELVVLCSSDEAYRELAPEVLEKLGGNVILVVAGYPQDSVEELRKKGIEHFIHVRSKLLDTLKHFNDLLGVEPK